MRLRLTLQAEHGPSCPCVVQLVLQYSAGSWDPVTKWTGSAQTHTHLTERTPEINGLCTHKYTHTHTHTHTHTLTHTHTVRPAEARGVSQFKQNKVNRSTESLITHLQETSFWSKNREVGLSFVFCSWGPEQNRCAGEVIDYCCSSRHISTQHEPTWEHGVVVCTVLWRASDQQYSTDTISSSSAPWYRPIPLSHVCWTRSRSRKHRTNKSP